MCYILEMDRVTFGAKPVIWQPGASTLAHWGTMWRSRSAWEDTKGHLEVQTSIFTDLGLISGPHFGIFSGTLGEIVFYYVRIQVF